MMQEFATYLALIVSRPWADAWFIWKKPSYKTRALVVFDRCIIAADREKNK